MDEQLIDFPLPSFSQTPKYFQFEYVSQFVSALVDKYFFEKPELYLSQTYQANVT